MPNVIQFPSLRIEQPISEASAMVRILIALFENLDDPQYASLRPAMTDQLYLIEDKMKYAIKALPLPFSAGAVS